MEDKLIGVLFGWILAQLSEFLRWFRQNRKERSAVRDAKRNLALALYAEIEESRKLIEQWPADDYRKSPAVIQENYFIIFDSTAARVTSLPSDDAKEVRRYYAQAKDYVDRLRTYNEVYGRWRAQQATSHAEVEGLNQAIRNLRPGIIALAEKVLASLKKDSA